MTSRRRAQRLVRVYPRRWRERYGDEFVELLIADIEERPRSPLRTLDVVRGGIRTRCAEAGLAGDGPASLAAFACAVAAFVAFGTGLWSQVMIAWQWSSPDAPVVSAALPLMSIALAVLVTVGFAALVPIVHAAIADRRAQLTVPALLTIAGTVVLVYGAIHISRHWPGTGGRPWHGKDLVPGGLASFGWAATLSITSYWAHPGALRTFPISQVAWMAIGPIAIATILTGTVKTLRHVALSPRALRFEVLLARLASAAMFVFLCGALAWIMSANAGPRGLFRHGLIDLIEVAIMAGAAIAARVLARRLPATPSGTSAALRASG
jgi:hypothetical protein